MAKTKASSSPRQQHPRYTHPDPYLSMWQSAAAVVHRANIRTGMLHMKESAANTADLMAPVHAVATAIQQGERVPEDIRAVEGFTLESIGVVKDCAKLAAQFLWAEMRRDHDRSQRLADELTKAVCDVGGWSTCLATYLAFKASGGNLPYRDHLNPVFDLPAAPRIAIIGDWGVGDNAAANVLREVKKQSPNVLIHLGDIYYSGTHDESAHNFLDICRLVLGPTLPVYTLCGNHDMYSGGNGYYWLLDQLGQQASYFTLKNQQWQVIAMDTGHNDCNPLTVATNMTSVNANEVNWVKSQITKSAASRTILLSHHQLFSPFGSVGTVGNVKYAYNPSLFDHFKDVLDRLEWWFWGHEHTLAVYEPYIGLRRGRCVGASAVPVFGDQQSYTPAADLETPDGKLPDWNRKAELPVNADSVYDHTFAILDLGNSPASVEYFNVPVDGTAVSLLKETADGK
ncbi:MAG TPA: metallophosphoesterase [Terriglobales bacterium]|nr:metallophosphoesterase [Terriglobales bacterium]